MVVEVQFQHDTDFYRRFFSEIFLFLRARGCAFQKWRLLASAER
ncbi:MAG: DUF2887 domain-containing protein [Cyanobacteria bacterium J06621_11]